MATPKDQSQQQQKKKDKAKKKSLPSEDMLAAATALTAVSIAKAYQRFLPKMPDEVILCGGGAHNKTLVKMLRQNLPQTTIRFSDDFGISCDAKEAVSFAHGFPVGNHCCGGAVEAHQQVAKVVVGIR